VCRHTLLPTTLAKIKMTPDNLPDEVDDTDLAEVDEIRLFGLRQSSQMYRLAGAIERRNGPPEAIALCREAGNDGQRLARMAAALLAAIGTEGTTI